MKNEIICYAQGYPIEKLNNLILSYHLNASNKDTELVILYKDMTFSTKDFDSKPVKVFSVDQIDKIYNVYTTLSPYTLKVLYFYLYCKYFSKANNVFLCDATDVFFNDDPFELVQENVSLFIEDQKIGNCPVNAEWMKICYNQDILNTLRNKSILNGGLILGSRVKCLDLLKEMYTDIAGVIGRIGNYRNLDQAVLNKVVYFDELNYHISRDNSMVNCAHISHLIPKFEHGLIDVFPDKDGIMPYVVHQYPCFKNLKITW